MLGAIGRFLYPSFAATFKSDYPLAMSVERFERVLAGYTFLDRLTGRTLVGDVYGREVRVHQSGWGGHSHYLMVFTGEFRQTETGVVLSGHFAMRAVHWAWPGLLLGFLSCCLAFSLLGVALHPSENWWVPAVPIGGIVLTVASVVQGQHIRSNRRWLSQTIARILGRPEDLTTHSDRRA